MTAKKEMQKEKKSVKNNIIIPAIPYIILILLIALAFANSLQNSFLDDDHLLIIDNPRINLPLKEIPSLFISPLWQSVGSAELIQAYYRPVKFLLLVLNYKIWGLNPFGFHLTNILLHLVSVIILYKIGLLLFNNDTLSSLIGASIFAVHPVNNEPVGMVAAGEVVFGFFIILSVHFFLKEKKYLSLFTFFLALLSKETAVMLPFALVILAIDKNGFKRGIITIIPYAVFIGIYLVLRVMILGIAFGSEVGQPMLIRIFTMAAAALDYIRLLIIPYPLMPFYPAKWHTSIFEPKVFLAIIILSLISFLAYRIRKDKTMLFLLISPFIMLVPVIWRVNALPIRTENAMFIAERFLYVPAMLFSVFASAYSIKLFKNIGKRYIAIGWGLIIIIFAIAAASAASVWKNDITLYKKILEKAPNFGFVHYNLGLAYYKQGRLDDAANEYLTALRLMPNFASAHNNLGSVYYDKNRLNDAINEYLTALRLEPNFAHARRNLGNAYFKQSRLDEAVKEYLTAIKLKPDFADAHYSLGNVYTEQDRLHEAIEECLTATRLKPNYTEAYFCLGNAYSKQSRLDDAVKEYLIAIKLKPDFADAHYNLGNVYYNQNRLDEAVNEYKTALRLEPKADAYNNLGFAYYTKGRLDEAVNEYLMALRLEHDNTESHYNLGLAYKEKGLKREAKKEFEAALKLKPDLTEAQKALKSLE